MVLRARGKVVERERVMRVEMSTSTDDRRNDACKELYLLMRMGLSVILHLRRNMLSRLLYIQTYF